jgi:putative serine protease PepD
VRQVSPQVVQIQTRRGLGSGVVYDGNGDIVTNAHVAADARQFLVTLPDGRRERATLVGTDPRHDLAVIRLSTPPRARRRSAIRPACTRAASSSRSATRSACSRA